MVQIAYENRLPTLLRREAARTAWREGDPALPALYIGHGAPPLFEDALWIEQLSQWADALPVPKGILIVSAHWEAAPLSLSAVATREVVYDFGGFHPRYYQMRYDTPAGEALAGDVLSALPDDWPDVATEPEADAPSVDESAPDESALESPVSIVMIGTHPHIASVAMMNLCIRSSSARICA